jgi:hypothetical protein
VHQLGEGLVEALLAVHGGGGVVRVLGTTALRLRQRVELLPALFVPRVVPHDQELPVRLLVDPGGDALALPVAIAHLDCHAAPPRSRRSTPSRDVRRADRFHSSKHASRGLDDR